MKSKSIRSQGRIHRAFTLVELLVVISIIALLLAVLMPALSKAKNQATTLVCKTRMKDVGLAFNMYIAANRGNMPYNDWPDQANPDGDQRWNILVAEYYNLKNKVTAGKTGTVYDYKLFRCPTQDYLTKLYQKNIASGNLNQRVPSPKTGKSIYPSGAAGIYGYNQYFSGIGIKNGIKTYDWRKESSIKQPSSLVILADLAAESTDKLYQNSECAGAVMDIEWPHPDAAKYGYKAMVANRNLRLYGAAPNHQGRINYAYADYHVETVSDLKPWNKDNYGTNSMPQSASTYFHPVRNTSTLPY